MYYDFYGFRQPPFNLTPDPQFLFLSSRHREALASLEYGIASRKGFIVLTGEIGAGKTTLCRTLIRRLGEHTRVALVLNSYLSDVELLQTINDEFKVASDSASKKELIDALNAFLLTQNAAGRDCLLVIDEAQNLAPETLEQVRMLSNLETETDKLVQILLMGQPELRDTLKLPRLEQLNQRITVRHHLQALDAAETEEYVRHRVRIAGAEGRVEFSGGAIARLYAFSRGVPRKINLVADRALLAGYAAEARTITQALVERAIVEVAGDPELLAGEEAIAHPGASARHAASSNGAPTAVGAPVAAMSMAGAPSYPMYGGYGGFPGAPGGQFAPLPPGSPGSGAYPAPWERAYAEGAAPPRRSATSAGGVLAGFALVVLLIVAIAAVGGAWWWVDSQRLRTTHPTTTVADVARPTPTPSSPSTSGAVAAVAEVPVPSEPTAPPTHSPTPNPTPTATHTPPPTPTPKPSPTPRPTPRPWSVDEGGIVRVRRPSQAFLAAQLTLLRRHYEGMNINLEAFAGMEPELLDGLNVDEIPALTQSGLRAIELDRRLDEVMAWGHPFIAELSDRHIAAGDSPFLLVSPQATDADPVVVADPQRGTRRVERDAFEDAFRVAHIIFFDPAQRSGLKLGDEGPRVAALQAALVAAKCWPEGAGAPRGTYGYETREAIEKLQRASRLHATGRTDDKTLFFLTLLERGALPPPTIAEGVGGGATVATPEETIAADSDAEPTVISVKRNLDDEEAEPASEATAPPAASASSPGPDSPRLISEEPTSP